MMLKVFFLIALLTFAAGTTEEENQQQHTYTGELKDAPLVTALNAQNDASTTYGSGGQPAAAGSIST
ncbi:unnamed protein product [Hermetia illucens]|uniref:Uncharacterized protein n=1 Tax=Hermetia illucens TaxID=343691 RepID=A0A7R8ULD2_HERIL|nr:unnamed protein product [Hermetia illucens]